MSDVNPNFAIRTINGDTNQWLPVVAPITCGQIVIQNTDSANPVKVRTDAADAATQKNAPAGIELTLRGSGPSIWGPNTTVCFVQPTASESPLVVSFLR
jgi:hypothetical protein